MPLLGCHIGAGEGINVLLKYSGGKQSLQGADFRAISSLALTRAGMKFSIYLRKLVPISHRALHPSRPEALLH